VLPYRLGATLFSVFGLLALVLSAIGLAGVLGYFVTERTPEIGIRRSLGAPVQSVVSLVVRQALVPVSVGILAGVAAALAGFRFLAALLFGVGAHDPIAFTGGVIFLLLTALIATLIPARRAAGVDPMLALRHD
jgi:ABC-type antimicrobial peptide transport system permease subunit